jgi:hypothetical protein
VGGRSRSSCFVTSCGCLSARSPVRNFTEPPLKMRKLVPRPVTLARFGEPGATFRAGVRVSTRSTGDAAVQRMYLGATFALCHRESQAGRKMPAQSLPGARP